MAYKSLDRLACKLSSQIIRNLFSLQLACLPKLRRQIPVLRPQPTAGTSGNILLIAMVSLFIVTTSTMAVLMVTANALSLCSRQRAGAAAFNIAESGSEVGALWLKGQAAPPSGTSAINPFGGSVSAGGGTYQVTVYPSPSNPTSFLKSYRLVSVGTALNVSKTVELVIRQASFGRYVYFTDKETSSVSGGAIWWKAGETIDGPAHSNNTSGSNFNINYNGSTAPIFLDMLTASGTSINYTPSKPTTEVTFKKIFLNGSKGYKLGVTPISLPITSNAQRDAAWGSSSGLPSTNGVFLRADSSGGIYIRGDAAVQLSLNGSGDQIVTVTQGAVVTNVTLNRATGSTSATGTVGTGSPTSTASLGTGVIYCTGNITSIKGTIADNRVVAGEIAVRSALTIATDVAAGKYMSVSNNLLYNTKPDKTLADSASVNLAAGTLGLVAKDIRIASAAPANLEIDAVCLASGTSSTDGSFYVENYSTKTPTGTLKVLGGIIQKSRGPVGTFNATTGVTTTGYSKSYKYDPRLADNPPPYFPTTGMYERTSWQLLPGT